MSTAAATALAVASSPSFGSSCRTTANAEKLNKRIKQQKDNNGKKTQTNFIDSTYLIPAVYLKAPLRNTTARHTCLTVQLSQSLLGQYKIQPNIFDPSQIISAKEEFPYPLPTFIFTQWTLLLCTKTS